MKYVFKYVLLVFMPVMIASCKTATSIPSERQQSMDDVNLYMVSHGHGITN